MRGREAKGIKGRGSGREDSERKGRGRMEGA